jgi:hypothetical protein
MEIRASVCEGHELGEGVWPFWAFDEGRVADLSKVMLYIFALR